MTDFEPGTADRSFADFAAARTKSFFRSVLAWLTGQPNTLMRFEDVREKLRIGGPIYRGMHTVHLDHIVGTVDRYADFDRAFLPTQDFTAFRWRRVNRAWFEDVSLPPIQLYKVGEVYFVVDGNHRVSVARERGQEFIEAEVRECAVKVPVTPDLHPDDLEVLGEQVEFLERSGLDRVVPGVLLRTTVLGGYDRILEHIAVHRFFMGIDWQRDIGDEEAVAHWYHHVYLPIVEVIRHSDILKNFPGRTETDLYLWALDHRHYLVERLQARLDEPARLAEEFVQMMNHSPSEPPDPLPPATSDNTPA